MKTENDFEATIERDLVETGCQRGNPDDYDRGLALFPGHLLDFIKATQPALWDELSQSHGEGLRAGLLDALSKNLDKAGTMEVLRHGFKFYGKRIDAAYFRPAHGLNPEVLRKYAQNIVAVTRQVHFNPEAEDSVDMVLSVNGLRLRRRHPVTGLVLLSVLSDLHDEPVQELTIGLLAHVSERIAQHRSLSYLGAHGGV